MSVIGFGTGLLAALALTSAASANVVVNGDFEGGTYLHPVYGYQCPNGWDWFSQSASGAGRGRMYPDVGPDGSVAHRLQLVSNSHAKSVIFQVIPTVPGRTYVFRAQWKSAIGKPDVNDNDNLSWCGAFFFDGGTPGDSAGNKALIDAFVPNVTGESHLYPHRSSNMNPDLGPVWTSPILPPNQEIVAEHAEDYGQMFNAWETIYDGAGGAGDPTMPGVGELAVNGGGAAWQTKTATGNYMIVGFFTLDTPSTNGGGSQLIIDNVVVSSSCNDPVADLDGDTDVDQADFALFQQCYTGTGSGVPAGCACADLNGDATGVDGQDYALFENCATGPGIPAVSNPPTCP